MSEHFPIQVDAGSTFETWLYYPEQDLTGCGAEMQLRRTATSEAYEFRFRSTPAEGLTIGQLEADVTLPSGRVIPTGSGYIRIRWEKSVTAQMSGSYVHSLRLTWPAGSDPEPDADTPITGPVIVAANVVR